MENRPKVAIVYDFDKTLCTRDMQEYAFIPSIGMSPGEFWGKTKILAESENMDRILAYLHTMVAESPNPVRREDLVAQGLEVELFPGVKEWFAMINEAGRNLGLDVEHYVISSGLREIIEGTPIFKEFREVYACEFLYKDGVAVWPKNTVNYTTKTQYLFRISKDVLPVYDDQRINERITSSEYRIPFRNMIYIADGLTDVPCMQLIKNFDGYSVAVHAGNEAVANKLINEKRVDFVCDADYSRGGELHRTVETIFRKISASEELREKTERCRRTASGEMDEDGRISETQSL